MAKDDWKTVKLPVLMLRDIDDLVDTDLAKKNGIFSRSDLLTRVLSGWLSNHIRDYYAFSNVKDETLRREGDSAIISR